MRITACVQGSGLYCAVAEDRPADLLQQLQAVGGPRLRRSNRYIALSLLGALDCVRGQQLLPDCAVYLSSGLGNVAETVAMLQPVLCEGLAPMPFSFINVSNNMAGFTLAQQLGLHGRNLAVARRGGAFGAALELALRDLRSGRVPQALVGAVDECVWPLAAHRQRLGLAADAPLLEGSAWLLLAPADAQADACGSLHWQAYADAAALSEAGHTLPEGSAWGMDAAISLPEGESPSRPAWAWIAALQQRPARFLASYQLGVGYVGLDYQGCE